MATNKLKKPACFSDDQWRVYQQELTERQGQRYLDVCFDCTVEFQRKMRIENRCDFPLKRLGKVTEFV